MTAADIVTNQQVRLNTVIELNNNVAATHPDPEARLVFEQRAEILRSYQAALEESGSTFRGLGPDVGDFGVQATIEQGKLSGALTSNSQISSTPGSGNSVASSWSSEQLDTAHARTTQFSQIVDAFKNFGVNPVVLGSAVEGLRQLGVVGDLVSLGITAVNASSLYEQGDMQGGNRLWTEFAFETSGGIAAGTAAAFVIGGIVGAPLWATIAAVVIVGLAAIDAAQSRPLVKAAISSSGIDDYTRVALLRAFDKEPRLLAAVDHITRQRAKSIGAMAVESHN
ncbi:hypothetical protein PUT78_17945 [Roseinatronobacter sp. HJB301]|uniref:Channel forming colicins domain-containing protein n=2 Tax=Roseinatronobacter alkalisoli TaxID=3028235 RepID=A0ABT5TCX1_9RHOB|nr:hypothetical protein [Roseinatronobacter sp. HJB301]